MTTLTDPSLAGEYSVYIDDKDFFVIKNREKLNFKGIEPSILDERLFLEIHRLATRSKTNGILNMWYHSLSVTPVNKEIIENVKFINSVGNGVDIIKVGHPTSVAASWTASKLGGGAMIIGDATMPKGSIVKFQPLIAGRVSDRLVYFSPEVNFQTSDNAENRAIFIVADLRNKQKMFTQLGYKIHFNRVPVSYLQVDKRPDFLELRLGFVLDVDPISGWIWVTNDKSRFKYELKPDNFNSKIKCLEFTGGEPVRETLRVCLAARFMVDQTLASYGRAFSAIHKWCDVKLKVGFDREEDVSALVSKGELTKIDVLMNSHATMGAKVLANPFAACLQGKKPQVTPQNDVQPNVDPGMNITPKTSPTPQIMNPFGTAQKLNSPNNNGNLMLQLMGDGNNNSPPVNLVTNKITKL